MADRKRIVILTADAGFGHRSAANAIATALDELYGNNLDVTILNLLEDKRAPFFLRDSQSDYDKMVRNVPELYKFGFDASDNTLPTAIAERALTVLLYEVMRDMIRKYRPDAVISTYPLYSAPFTAVCTISRLSIPYLLAITDLVTVHRLWFHSNVDGLMVPTSAMRRLAISYGIPAEKIHVTGIPINPAIFHHDRPPHEIRTRLGWNPDLLTLLAVGSKRVENMVEALNVVNHFGYPMQLVAVTGKDAEMYAELQAMDWHIPVHLFEYASNMPELMQASDCIMCKAGGLIVTESLAAGLPMMLIDVIPGQETGNAEFVLENGVGDLARTPIEVLETLAHWTMNGEELLAQRASAARKMGKPRAALDIARIVWRAAQAGPHRRERARRGRPGLVELLTKNQVSLQADDDLSERKIE